MDVVLLTNGATGLDPVGTDDVPQGGTSVDTMVVGVAGGGSSTEYAVAGPYLGASANSGGTAGAFGGQAAMLPLVGSSRSAGTATPSGTDQPFSGATTADSSAWAFAPAVPFTAFDPGVPGDAVAPGAGPISGGGQGAVSGGAASAGPLDPVTSAVVSGSTPGGLVFNIGFDQADSALPSGFKAAVIASFQFYADMFNDPVTLYIDVGYGEAGGVGLGSGALGESFTNFGRPRPTRIFAQGSAPIARPRPMPPRSPPICRQPIRPAARPWRWPSR